jgi:outer membrane protein
MRHRRPTLALPGLLQPVVKPWRALLLAGAAFLALQATPAQAQSMTEALSEAYTNNPTLQAARARLRATDENVPQALSNWRPTVTAGANYGVADGESRTSRAGSATDTSRNPRGANLTVTQPLYRGGRTVAGTNRAEAQVLAERARLMATEQQVLSDGVNAYVNVLRDSALLRLNQNNERVLTRQLQATNDRFRVGEITRTDVAQAEARLARARADREAAEGNLQNSRANYVRVIGAQPGALREPGPLATPVRSREEAISMAAGNNPNVIAANFDERAAIDNVDLIFGELLPSVSLQGQAFDNTDPSVRGGFSRGYQASAVLSVPIYQGGQEYSRVRQAKQQAQLARQVLDDTRRQSQEAASRAWDTLNTARAQVNSTRAQIRASEVALDGVSREALVGSRTTLDVLNAEQELLDARVSLVRALRDLVVASYALAAATGRLSARDLGLQVDFYDSDANYRAVRGRVVGTGVPGDPLRR